MVSGSISSELLKILEEYKINKSSREHIKKHACPSCTYTGWRKRDVEEHWNTHHNSCFIRFKCPHEKCGASYRYKRGLKRHMKQDHNTIEDKDKIEI